MKQRCTDHCSDTALILLLPLLLLAFQLLNDVVGNIENPLSRLIAYSTALSLGVVLESTMLAKIVLATCHHGVLALVPRFAAYVARKRQAVIFLFLLQTVEQWLY